MRPHGPWLTSAFCSSLITMCSTWKSETGKVRDAVVAALEAGYRYVFASATRAWRALRSSGGPPAVPARD
jgi:hypothetical protein